MNEKQCPMCLTNFTKKIKDSYKQWCGRIFCSSACSNKANGLARQKNINTRFWDKVIISTPKECWKWSGVTDGAGYGMIHLDSNNKKCIKVHRLSYELHNGILKKGMVIMHTCDNPVCVNPNHLKQGTQKDNMRDCSRKGRLNPFSLLNLRPGEKGKHGAGSISNKEKNNAK